MISWRVSNGHTEFDESTAPRKGNALLIDL